MRYGFYLPTRGPTAAPEALETLVARGEALGFASVMIADHVVFPVIADRDRVVSAGLPSGEAEQSDALADHALETGSGQGPLHHRVGPVRWPVVGQPDFGGRGIGHLVPPIVDSM